MATPPQRPGFPARLDLGRGNATAGAAPRPAVPRPAPARAAGAEGTAPINAPAPVRDTIPARARMVQQLMAEGISDPQVLRAMGSVDRHRFVDSALVTQAYEDTA